MISWRSPKVIYRGHSTWMRAKYHQWACSNVHFTVSKTFISSFCEQFIAIHSRRGDFADICTDHREPSCLNPLSTFAEKLDQIRASLLLKHNMNVTQVLLASSELFYFKTQPLRLNWQRLLNNGNLFLQMKMTQRSGRKFDLMVGFTSITRKNKHWKSLESGICRSWMLLDRKSVV